MAIVQISRITNRKGLVDDLPQPLASAELGWATNTRQLFIGNGTVAEGAPVVGNTEILTEFTDIFSLRAGYVYKGESAGYIVQTGPTADQPVTQTLQARLDSYAIATDFGIVGDGATDNTQAINNALYQLYCRNGSSPSSYRGLFFPAGIYLISNTLNIPANATLYGDSINGSIIQFNVPTWNLILSYAPNVTVQYEDAFYTSLAAVPPNIGLGDANYWQPVSKPLYVARTADSNQNIDTSIGLNSGIPPTGISVTDMVFGTTLNIDALLMQYVTNSVFTNVSFVGPYTQDDIAASPAETMAIDWSSTEVYVSAQNKFINCTFKGFYRASKTDQQIANNTFKDSAFDTLYQGLVLGGATPVNGGATGTRIVNNTFDNIYMQGILLQNVSLNATGNNTFLDVGNHFNGNDSPAAPVIEFDADNNVSVGDMFARTQAQAASSGYALIETGNKLNIAFEDATRIKLGSYQRDSGITATLSDAQTDQTLFTISAASARAFNMEYTVVRGVSVRTGRLTVVSSVDGESPTLAYSDSGLNNIDTGVTFSATESGGIVAVLYSTTAIALDAQISYSVTKLA